MSKFQCYSIDPETMIAHLRPIGGHIQVVESAALLECQNACERLKISIKQSRESQKDLMKEWSACSKSYNFDQARIKQLEAELKHEKHFRLLVEMDKYAQADEIERLKVEIDASEASFASRALLCDKYAGDIDRLENAFAQLGESKLKMEDDLSAELKQAKGVLQLKEDEYVQHVGTWKIIKRLEEELTQAKGEISKLQDEWMEENNQAGIRREKSETELERTKREIENRKKIQEDTLNRLYMESKNVQSLQRELERVKAELATTTEWKNTFMEMVEGESGINERWQGYNKELQDELAQTKKTARDWNIEANRLRAELEQAKAALDRKTNGIL